MPGPSSKGLGRVLSWALIAILAPSFLLKFAGAGPSVHVFTALGVEPWGRYLAGLAELAACILLFAPRTRAIGAALTLAVISGALLSHLTRLGIVVDGDHGFLFASACLAFGLGLTLLFHLTTSGKARIVAS